MNLADSRRRTAALVAFRLEWLTIAWMIIEAAVAVVAGTIAHSITLTAFGVDSVIELASAVLLLWRLDIEIRKGREFSEFAERRASKVSALLLYGLALYVLLSAGWGVWNRQGESFSFAGLAVALFAIPVMYLLARKKLAIAEIIGSRALRADAVEAITCGYLSFVVVIGMFAQLLLHVWWIDAATSLAILYFVVKEAREAWKADDCQCTERFEKVRG